MCRCESADTVLRPAERSSEQAVRGPATSNTTIFAADCSRSRLRTGTIRRSLVAMSATLGGSGALPQCDIS